jgi:hypothetical protein
LSAAERNPADEPVASEWVWFPAAACVEPVPSETLSPSLSRTSPPLVLIFARRLPLLNSRPGSLASETDSVPLVVTVPVRPSPLPTLVTVPVPETAAHLSPVV